ncbi:thermonuclease family protein [Novosphingobium sp. 9U]|uniref:thermonuclease family protein n=1 Tax=Novosphingobium sp. 9U TaxID=2653158 RepID=UPI0012F24690|nr:thermonuclease family protein [Novosphingobium sp. 9U]VWX48331.1 Nuclease [Novosphingobium sp. 9U]
MIRLAIIAALASFQPAVAQTITGTAHAGDGDSFEVAGTKVRLFGVDAPEYRQTCQVNHSEWACGADAASALRVLIDNRLVTCIRRDTDVYNRTVANCMINGQDVAAQLVAQGYAIVLENGQADYAVIEARANAGKVGIWATKFDMPVDWRRAHARNPDAVRSPNSEQWSAPVRSQPRSSGYMYRNCDQARAAGAAPMRRGTAAYNPSLDGDNDGLACEPYRGRR